MAEKEYIEREAALDAITYNPIEKPTEPDVIELTLLTAQKQIRKVPAADVVEVRHGEWIETIEYKTTLSKLYIRKEKSYCCPYCARVYRQRMNYCGNCGAKMDGERKRVNDL